MNNLKAYTPFCLLLLCIIAAINLIWWHKTYIWHYYGIPRHTCLLVSFEDNWLEHSISLWYWAKIHKISFVKWVYPNGRSNNICIPLSLLQPIQLSNNTCLPTFEESKLHYQLNYLLFLIKRFSLWPLQWAI